MAVRLCQIAADHWDQIDAAYYQIDLLRQRPSRFIGLIFAWAIERVAADKLEGWLTDLYDLLEWQDSDSEAAVNLESDSFMNMMAKGQ